MIDADRRERLESWKEIAVYLRRGVTTVQRWEQHEGLPVHRLPHAKKGSIFAIKSELDDWWRARAHLVDARHDDVVPSEPPRLLQLDRRTSVGLATVIALAAIGLVTSRMLGRRPAPAIAATESSPVPRPLANDVAGESCPSPSPDGSRVIYLWDRGTDGERYMFIPRFTDEMGRTALPAGADTVRWRY